MGCSLFRFPLSSLIVKYELTVGLLAASQTDALFVVRPINRPSMEWQNVSPNWNMTVPSLKIEERPISRGRQFPDAWPRQYVSISHEGRTYNHASIPSESEESTWVARELVFARLPSDLFHDQVIWMIVRKPSCTMYRCLCGAV